MLLTTSKNLKSEYKKIAKKFSKAVWGLSFSSRKNRSLEDLSTLALKKYESSVGVFGVLDKKFVIKKYFYNPKLDIFEWDKKFLLLWNLKFSSEKVSFLPPIKIESIGKKELLRFLELNSEPLAEILIPNNFLIKVSKNLATFFYNKKETLSFNFSIQEGVK
ncbi:MAG: hypothetical protein QXV83_04000 [Candidatus Anstonellaceae archaeon]